jgi:hypothetical protein
MLWYDSMLPMLPCKGLTLADFDHMEDMYYIQYEEELLGQDWLKTYATEILDAKYKWTDIEKSLMVKPTSEHNRNVICLMFS